VEYTAKIRYNTLEGANSPKEADTLLSRSTDVAVEFEKSGTSSFYCLFAVENVRIWPPSKALFGAIRHILAKIQDAGNK